VRYPKDQREKTRATLVSSGAKLAKKRGFAASGVDSLAKAAGMTNGAFYKHFRGKNELLQAIAEHELQRSLNLFFVQGHLKGADWLRATVDRYFGAENVEEPDLGCIVPSLATEIARGGIATRRSFDKGMRAIIDEIALHSDGKERAWAMIAMLVGAVVIARGMAQPAGRREVLDACASILRKGEPLFRG
jgi:TetR/AcrR family transcriptional repressor of nem operon